MKHLDKLFFGLMMGAAFPVCAMMVAMVLWFFLDKNTHHLPYFLVPALLLGAAMDIVCLKRLVVGLYQLPLWLVVAFYLFYNIGMLGFFMGIPVFNLAMGAVAGYYYGKKMVSENMSAARRHQMAHRVSLFAGVVMALICAASATVALIDPYTGGNLRGMLRLDFEVTRAMVLALVIVGGTALVVLQYFITKLTIAKTAGGHFVAVH